MREKFIDYLLKNQIIFALLIISLAWFILQIRGIIVSVFLSYIIMASVLPFVNYLRARRFPKILAVLIPYLGMICFIFLLVFPLIPFFVQQIQALIVNFPIYLNKTTAAFGVTVDQKQLQAAFSTDFNTIGENAFALTSRVFGGVISVVTILVVSFYMLFYHDKFKLWLSGFFYKSYHTYSLETLSQIEDKLGAWLRGQLILCITIGLFSWIALSLLGVPFALPLALLAGILEILPTLGPMLSAIPSLIVAITISPTMAIVVALTYFVIQFFENHILVPKIMQRAVGLNPIVVILAIMIGANLMGIAGALLSIPFISFIIVLLNSIKNVEK